MDIRKEVASVLSGQAKLPEKAIIGLLETPPDQEMGDLALPCFSLARELKKDPKAIAADLASSIKPEGVVREIKPAGPYLNVFLDWAKLGQGILETALKEGECYGSSKPKKELTILIEYPGPNTNKPLHLGHMRNMALGSSMSNIFRMLGHRVHDVNINNDRGVHICKSMLAYKKWGRGKEPDKKSDHFVGDFYVLYSQKARENPGLEDEVRGILSDWESGDRETIALWKKMNKWALDGFQETYKRFGISLEKEYLESETYIKGKEMVLEGLKKGTFQKDETGAIVFDLKKFGLDKKILVRSDGTSVYMTQDLYLAKKKYQDFRFDKSVYVVANEQNYHFQVLFRALEALGLPWWKGCYHMSYGMVNLPTGKMKSREGTVVDADDIMDEMERLARKEILDRDKGMPKKELDARARMIALAAIKYFLLKVDSVKDMTFNPKESISLEGDTGPYIQYSHARICSILRKSKVKSVSAFDAGELKDKRELALLRVLLEFPGAVQDAARDFRPHYISSHVYRLAVCFNDFYEHCSVLKAGPGVKEARLALARAAQIAIRNGLALLGIEAPEKM